MTNDNTSKAMFGPELIKLLENFKKTDFNNVLMSKDKTLENKLREAHIIYNANAKPFKPFDYPILRLNERSNKP